ncbi:MAG: hypothetical protein ACKVI6_01155 [Candidatus Poseidoniales archaeon]
MANKLTREETSEILKKVYQDNLKGPEMTKKISNIPKLLDKFEGKHDKMVEALYKKYPEKAKEHSEEDNLHDYQPVEKSLDKKEVSIFPDADEEPAVVLTEPEEEEEEPAAILTEPEEDIITTLEEDEEPAAVLIEPDEDIFAALEEDEEEDKFSRSRVSVLMEESYRQNLDDPDKKIAGISKLLDKFEGRYDKLMEAMSEKYPLRDYKTSTPSVKSLDELLNLIKNDNNSSKYWGELAEYYVSVGKIGRSTECKNYANTL